MQHPRMLDMETTGASKLDNYQNFAKAFRVREAIASRLRNQRLQTLAPTLQRGSQAAATLRRRVEIRTAGAVKTAFPRKAWERAVRHRRLQ